MRSDPNWKDYCKRSDDIAKKISDACRQAGHKKVRVYYSAYKSDENDLPIDNLNEIAACGKVILVRDRDEFFGGEKSKSYRSSVLENPTWLQVAVCANAMIARTRDEHHHFLEGLYYTHEVAEDGVKVYELAMGS